MKILVVSLGGTISQKAASDGSMTVDVDQRSLCAVAEGVSLRFEELRKSTGANLQISDLFEMRKCIDANLSHYDGFVILVGTDSAEEIVFGLDLLLDMDKPVVATGAMRPADALGYDGLSNFRDAIMILRHAAASRSGVLFVISEEIHAARYVRKSDSQALSAFASPNGPMGRIRRGEPKFYYHGLPPIRKFLSIGKKLADLHVPIVPMYLGCRVQAEDFMQCHGLVLAGMGTGSLPDRVVDELSPSITSKIPVCITTRCISGGSYDDFHYKGSLNKYESRGFILRPYEELSPYQARIRLMFDLMDKDSPL